MLGNALDTRDRLDLVKDPGTLFFQVRPEKLAVVPTDPALLDKDFRAPSGNLLLMAYDLDFVRHGFPNGTQALEPARLNWLEIKK